MGFRSIAPLALLTLPLMAACESATTAEGDSHFSVNVAGDVTAGFEGVGRFHLARGPRPGLFILHSVGINDSRGQFLQIAHPGGGIPEVGSYDIGAPGTASRPAGFHAIYGVLGEDRMERYSALRGTLEITSSSSSVVEGTFEFVALRVSVCERANTSARCENALRGADPGDLPTVTVSGSFRARVGPPPTGGLMENR